MTKKKIAWVTDSTAYITEELANHPDVFVLPLSIIFGSESFEDGVTLSTEELYARISAEKEIPKTSQPAVGKFVELYERLRNEYEGAIAVHISSKLSGTLSSSQSAAEMANFPVEIVDSKSMSYAITTLIEIGMKLAETDMETAAIAEQLRAEAEQSENYILLGSLEQFYKGGRMSSTQYLLGSLLKIKPVLQINRKGEFELFEKIRSEKKALKRIIELLGQSRAQHTIKQVQIMHGNVQEKALKLKEEIHHHFPELDIVIGEISSTIAVHAGEGTVAVIWHLES